MVIDYNGLKVSNLINNAIKDYFEKVMQSLCLNEKDYKYDVYEASGELMLTIDFIHMRNSLPKFEIEGKSYDVINDISPDYIGEKHLSISFLRGVLEVVDGEIILKQ